MTRNRDMYPHYYEDEKFLERVTDVKPGSINHMKYEPRNIDEALAKVAEEASEVVKEACKAIRFGAMSSNPKEPFEGTNLVRLNHEFNDLKEAMAFLNNYVLTHWNDPSLNKPAAKEKASG